LRGLDADGAAFGSLSDLALDEAAEQVTAICMATASPGGATALSAAAHGLKSSAAIVGARRLVSLADAIERKGRTGAMPEPALLDELRRLLAATKQAVIDVDEGC
jgi:HPt (histidine-containing phosphotransfer) domain-containing protein